jgi:hypothetical protein
MLLSRSCDGLGQRVTAGFFRCSIAVICLEIRAGVAGFST